jgi:hypothetical protein
MRALVIAGLICGALAPAGLAAEFHVAPMPQGRGDAIWMTGILAPGDEAAFRSTAAPLRQATVITTGPGGTVAAALIIGSEIRSRGWATLVPEKTNCASACALIWLAGQTRYLARDAQIGFHALSVTHGDERTESHEADTYLRQWLTALGYAVDTTATIVNTRAGAVRWLDATELRANGIATEPYP